MGDCRDIRCSPDLSSSDSHIAGKVSVYDPGFDVYILLHLHSKGDTIKVHSLKAKDARCLPAPSNSKDLGAKDAFVVPTAHDYTEVLNFDP